MPNLFQHFPLFTVIHDKNDYLCGRYYKRGLFMKSFLKFIGALLLGSLIGLICVIPIIVLGSGESFSTVVNKIFGPDALPYLAKAAMTIILICVAFFLQLIIHEGGHLVTGLLTGYRFVSFRILNWLLIRKDGRLQWRNFELAGTGGQCLLAPPDKPVDQIDTRWYNAGGVLANVITAVLAIVLMWTVDMPLWLHALMFLMAVIGGALALLNGIPMKVGGVANDGLNLFQMEKDRPAKLCFCNILDVNARCQEGETYTQMPERLFALPDPIDWENSMHVASVLLAVTRMMAFHQWEDAYQLLTEAYNNKDNYMRLYQLEIENMMTQVCIFTGRDDEARRHYTKEVAKHVSQHAPTQSDKQLTLMAVALALDGNRPRAEQMFKELEARRDKYAHQSDVALSLDLMKWLLDNRS